MIPSGTIRIHVICLVILLLSQRVTGQVFQWGVNFPSYEARALTIDTAGNPVIGGSFQFTSDFDPGPGTEMLTPNSLDGFISKFSSTGNFQWVQQVSGSFYQQVLATVVDSVNNIFVCGNYRSSQGMVEKRDANGMVIWSRTFSINSSSFNWYIQCRAMVPDPLGNLYVTGYFRNNCNFSQNPPIAIFSASETAFIAKIDPLGNVIWVKSTFTPTDFDDCSGNAIALDHAGGIYETGRYDGTVDFNPDTASAFYLTSPGSLTNSCTFILKLDTAGNFIWVKEITYSSVNYQNCMTMDPANNLIITGSANSQSDFDPGPGVYGFPGLNNGAYVAKFDTSGSLVWAKVFPGNGSGKAVASDDVGNIYLAGDFTGLSFDLDPGPAANTVSSQGWYDGFIVKLNQAGQFLWGGTTGGSGYNIMSAVKVHKNGNIFFSGTFNGDHDLDPFSNILTVSDTTNNTFLCRISQCGYSSQTVAVSGCDTAWYNGIPFTNNGPHFITYTDISGCDSTTILNISIHPTYYQTIPVTGCDSVVLNGQVITTSGGYVSNLNSINGCDSIVYYPITVYPSYQSINSLAGCDSVAYNGQVYFASSQLTSTYSSVYGCDSIHITDITVHPGIGSVQYLTGCDSLDVNGQVYTVSGSYQQNLVSVNNCDSTVQYHVTINNSTSSAANVTGCDSITINGQTYTSGGIYTQILTNSAGCDSILTLNITLNNSTSSTVTISGCDSISFNSLVFYNSGFYQIVIVNSAGCDSIIGLTAIIYNLNSSVTQNGTTLTAAPGYLYQWVDCNAGYNPIPGATGNTFTATANGNYAVIVSLAGCTDTSACHVITTVGKNEVHYATAWLLYPNPATGELQLTVQDNRNKFYVTIYDYSGKIISEHTFVDEKFIRIDISNYVNGHYSLRIYQDNFSEVRKFVIHK